MKIKIMLSLIIGFLFAISLHIFFSYAGADIDLSLSLLVGLFFSAALFVAFYLNEKNMEKKYRQLEEYIDSPIFYKANGNFNLGYTVRNGNIYFCDSGILFALLDGKTPILDELPAHRIDDFHFEPPKLFIHTVEGDQYIITTDKVREIHAALIGKGWILD